MDAAQKKIIDEQRHTIHTIGKLRDLRDMLDRSESQFAANVAISEKDHGKLVSYTMKQFSDRRRAFGTALIEMGLKGKHVAIIGRSSYNWIVSFLTMACGVGVAVPLDRELPTEDIDRLISKADCEALIFAEGYEEVARLHKQNDPSCKYYIMMDKYDGDEFLAMDDVVAKGEELLKNGDRRYVDAEIDREATCAIFFTSGTTGANKGVMLSNKNLATNVDGVVDTIITEYSSFSLLPLNHVFELCGNIFTALYMGAPIYINDSLKNVQKNLKLYKPDAMNAVPLVLESIYDGIWATAKKSGKDKILRKLLKFSNFLRRHGIDKRALFFKTIKDNLSLSTLVCGGAPPRAEFVTGLGDFGFRVYNGYGLTEASPTVTLNMEADRDPLSAGFAFPQSEFIIHDPDEKGIGEIWIRGDNVTCGYYKDPEATAASFEDGWFKTGDYGRVTPEGELYVSGRKKTLIILDNGENVFPEELEFTVMDAIPYIKESCAFEAVRKGSAGKKIIAMGVYVDKADFPGKSEDEIRAMVKKDVAKVNETQPKYKIIADVMVCFEEFEKTSTRKIIIKKVVEKYNDSMKGNA